MWTIGSRVERIDTGRQGRIVQPPTRSCGVAMVQYGNGTEEHVATLLLDPLDVPAPTSSASTHAVPTRA